MESLPSAPPSFLDLYLTIVLVIVAGVAMGRLYVPKLILLLLQLTESGRYFAQKLLWKVVDANPRLSSEIPIHESM
jgi:uncharacterized protein YneF (UPF0154 family)